MHDILKKKILFFSIHLPKSPPEGDGPLGRFSPSVVKKVNLCNFQYEKKVILLKHQETDVVWKLFGLDWPSKLCFCHVVAEYIFTE